MNTIRPDRYWYGLAVMFVVWVVICGILVELAGAPRTWDEIRLRPWRQRRPDAECRTRPPRPVLRLRRASSV
jgi:hypothetical protein